jgi:hypothetical protein
VATQSPVVEKPKRVESVGSPPQTRFRNQRAFAVLSLLILLAAVIWLGFAALSAVPEVVPANASPLVFSAERAMIPLRVLATEPHPVGSAANAAVRDYLTAQIAALGLSPQLQATHVLRHTPGFPEAHVMAVENVLVRVPGADPGGKALLVSGHYDSVSTSVGASDCAMCTATVLETLRAVVAAAAAGQPLRNDVIFLFTDAEEIGVAGATGFMRDHPWAADVGLSLVFEGLGSDGAPLLYISGPDSGALTAEALDALDEGTRFPLASSFLHDFMWTVAGNTGSDLDAFVEGAPGLGFIYLSLETVANYHSGADSEAALDPRSLQGMGDFALTLTRHFGDRALDDLPEAPNLVMIPIAPGVVARYSSRAALPLAVVAAALLVAWLVVGLRRGHMSGRALLAAFAVWLPIVLSAVVVVSVVWWLVRFLSPGLHNFTAGGWWGSGFYLAASLTLGLAVAAGWRALLRRFTAVELLVGWLGWWAVLALLTAAALPGLSYLFVWPLLAGALVGLLVAWRPGNEWLPPVAAAVVALALAGPVAAWLWIYTGRAEAMMGLPMAALPVLFCLPALMMALLAVESVAGPARRPTALRRRGFVALALAVLSLVLFAVPALSRPSAERPWFNTVVYDVRPDQNEAYWVTFNDSRAGRGVGQQLDEWTNQFFAAGAEATTFDPWLLTRSDTPYPALRATAPVVSLRHTTIAADGPAEATRLRLTRPAEAGLTRLVVKSTAPLAAITFDGQALDLGGVQPTEYTFLVIGRADEVTLDLTTTGPGALSVDVLDRLTMDVMAVAQQAGLPVAPRPAWMATAPASDTGDSALVTTTYQR